MATICEIIILHAAKTGAFFLEVAMTLLTAAIRSETRWSLPSQADMIESPTNANTLDDVPDAVKFRLAELMDQF